MNAIDPLRLLLVEDNRSEALLLQEMLASRGPGAFDVTWVDRLGKAIERAKMEWERTFDSVPDLIAILDENHRIVRANRAMADRLGKTPSACVGLPCHVWVHGMDCPPDSCPHSLTLADGAQHVLELHENRMGGDFMVSTTPLHDDTGRMIGTVHVARDITDRKQAEEREKKALALVTAARTAADALEAMGEGLMLINEGGLIRSVNPALEQMSGYAEEELANRALRDVLPVILAGEDLPAATQALARGNAAEPLHLQPMTLIAKRGRRVPVMPAVSFVRGTDNRPTATVFTLRDITQIREVQKSLEQSNTLLERIFDTTYMLIAYLDPQFNFIRVNRAYAEATRRPADFFRDKNHFALYPHAENESIFRSVCDSGLPHTVHEKPFPFLGDEGNGSTFWDWSLLPVKTPAGAVEGLLLCLIDVTHRKLREEEWRAYQDHVQFLAARLASIEEEERHRIAVHLHDSVIQSLSLSFIKLGALRGAMEAENRMQPVVAIDTVRALIQDGITECRLTMADLVPPLLYELGLGPAVEELAQRLGERHGTPVTVQYDELPEMEKPLRGLCFQCVRELVTNALKHAHASQVAVTIAADGNGVRLRVRDDGDGFDAPAALRRTRDTRGGFGLFSIRERVQGMGGRADVDSAPGRGTVVTIDLPLGAAG